MERNARIIHLAGLVDRLVGWMDGSNRMGFGGLLGWVASRCVGVGGQMGGCDWIQTMPFRRVEFLLLLITL